MNRLDQEILHAILLEDMSIYRLQKKINFPYPTVWRHIKKLQKDLCVDVCEVKTKKGKIDQRNTQMVSLTFKGLVMFMFEGDVGKYWANAKAQDEVSDKFFERLKVKRESFLEPVEERQDLVLVETKGGKFMLVKDGRKKGFEVKGVIGKI